MKHNKLLVGSFLLIITISAAIYYSTRKTSSNDILKKIPLQEQKQLSDFFETLILRTPFGYTIFGDKPVSVANFNPIPNSFGLTLINNSDLILRNGVLVWQK